MDEHDWDEIWSDMAEGGRADPLTDDLISKMAPGRSIDLGCGLGDNVMALAAAGWEAHGADSSTVAMTNAATIASQRGVSATFTVADLADGIPGSGYDLITMFYVHLQTEMHRRLLSGVSIALNPGGVFVYVGHDEEFVSSHDGRMGDLEHGDGDHGHSEVNSGHHGSGGHHDNEEDIWADREIGGPDQIASFLTGLTIDRAESVSRRVFHGPQEIDVTDVVVMAVND